MFKKRKLLKKMEAHLSDWDSERHGWTIVTPDGRLIPTNNKQYSYMQFSKQDFESFVAFISNHA